jgi:rod shape-determining protein MreD
VTPRRLALGAAVLLTAWLLQGAVLSQLPLPGAAPDLLLVVIVGFALAEGPGSGALTGFVAGLLVDLGADHELGRVALAYALAGYVAGLVHDGPDRSRLLPLGVVAAAAAVAVTAFAAEGVLLSDPRTTVSAWATGLAATVAWCAVLAPLVVPVVGALVRRLDDDPLRR